MDLHDDWKEFLRLLNSHGVEYLVVGAHALAFHGLPRMTGDLDFFVSSGPDNVERLFQVLTEFGFGESLPLRDDLVTQRRVLMLGRIPYRIDILNDISGIEFEEAWSNRVTAEINGVSIHFISDQDLLTNKRASGRMKDLADAEELTALRSKQG